MHGRLSRAFFLNHNNNRNKMEKKIREVGILKQGIMLESLKVVFELMAVRCF